VDFFPLCVLKEEARQFGRLPNWTPKGRPQGEGLGCPDSNGTREKAVNARAGYLSRRRKPGVNPPLFVRLLRISIHPGTALNGSEVKGKTTRNNGESLPVSIISADSLELAGFSLSG